MHCRSLRVGAGVRLGCSRTQFDFAGLDRDAITTGAGRAHYVRASIPTAMALRFADIACLVEDNASEIEAREVPGGHHGIDAVVGDVLGDAHSQLRSRISDR